MFRLEEKAFAKVFKKCNLDMSTTRADNDNLKRMLEGSVAASAPDE